MNHGSLGMAVLFTFLAAWPARGDEILRRIAWTEVQRQQRLPEGARLEPDGSVRVENVGDTPVTVPLLRIAAPEITSPAYALRGTVRYESVAGAGYLELLNRFPGSKTYFSRTLADVGPLQRLQGTAGWRPFMLPFYVRDESGWLPDRPDGLEFNVTLPGKGVVWLRSAELVMLAADASASTGSWWSRSAGLRFGSIGGCLFGVLGALLGSLSSAGRARTFVLTTLCIVIATGVIAAIAGVIALIQHQPYEVYYPLLLIGGLGAALFGFLTPAIRRRYQQLELRRLEALDA